MIFRSKSSGSSRCAAALLYRLVPNRDNINMLKSSVSWLPTCKHNNNNKIQFLYSE